MEEYMKPMSINIDVKNEHFFFVDSGMFVFIKPAGQQNKICMFCDKITDIGRKYADSNTTILSFPAAGYEKTDQEKYISHKRIEYWHCLFNLGIWKYLKKNNEVTFMQEPQRIKADISKDSFPDN